jgi:hypothetical protein
VVWREGTELVSMVGTLDAPDAGFLAGRASLIWLTT